MSEATSGNLEFSGWRAFLWPVHRHELKKLIPMLLIFFLITFDYNVLRATKDTLVVTAKASGAEVIPFIKVWVMLPGAFLMTFLFTRLSNRVKREAVFYLMLGGFLSYFFLFATVLYPARNSLHPHAAADALQSILPIGLKGLVAMFRNWTFTSFYVMSELWSNIILFLLFWGFANQVTRLNEAKRFYSLFGIAANFSGVVAGQTCVYLCRSDYNPLLPFGHDAWEQSLIILVSLVLLAGITAIAIFRWLHVNVLSDPLYCDSETEETQQKNKVKLSMRQSFKYLMKSRYLIYIALIVLGYNLVINLIEIVWKHELKTLYPNPADYTLYFSQVMVWTGSIATFSAIFISGNAIRRCGWKFTAMLTPMIMLITSIGFFTCFFFKEQLSGIAMTMFHTTPLMLVVFFGSAQNVLSRAAKYTVYDETKEIAFIPLNTESKLKGKAAIDGVCSRLGKSGGALMHQSLLLTFSTITASAPYVAVLLFSIIGLWIFATRSLGKQFNVLTTPKKEENAKTLLTSLQEQQAI